MFSHLIWTNQRLHITILECIPVGCVPPAHWPYLVASARGGGHVWHTCPPPCHTCPCHTHTLPHTPSVPRTPPQPHTPPAMHTPLPHTPILPPCTPPAMHAPCHACLPLPPPTMHIPSAMHTPCHTCPPAMHAPFSCGQNDRQLWKHNLRLRAAQINWVQILRFFLPEDKMSGCFVVSSPVTLTIHVRKLQFGIFKQTVCVRMSLSLSVNDSLAKRKDSFRLVRKQKWQRFQMGS